MGLATPNDLDLTYNILLIWKSLKRQHQHSTPLLDRSSGTFYRDQQAWPDLRGQSESRFPNFLRFSPACLPLE